MLPNGIKKKIADLAPVLARQQNLRRGGAAVLLLQLTAILVYSDLIGDRSEYVVGQVSPVTIKAEKNIIFEDKNKTNVERNLAAEKVGVFYTVNSSVIDAAQKDVTDLAVKVTETQTDEDMDAAGKVEVLRGLMPESKEADLAILAQTTQADNEYAATVVNDLIGEFMVEANGITQEALDEQRNNIIDMIINLRMDGSNELFAVNAVERCVRPNLFIDYDLTKQKQEEAMDAVLPVMVTVQEGEKIIGEGEIITEEHLDKLQARGISGSVAISVFGVLLTLLLPLILLVIYLYQNCRDI